MNDRLPELERLHAELGVVGRESLVGWAVGEIRRLRWEVRDLERLIDDEEPLKEVERLRGELAKFNTSWPHDPPQGGDTKWVRLRWIGRQQSRIEEGKCDE